MAARGVGATGPESSTREILPGWISIRWNDRAPAASTRVLEALHELGYVEGKNLIVEIREARGQLDRLPKLASELVDTHPDVIVAVTNSAVAAAKNATRRFRS